MNQFKNIRELIVERQYNEAMRTISSKLKSINDPIAKLELNTLKASIYRETGKYSDAIDLLEDIDPVNRKQYPTLNLKIQLELVANYFREGLKENAWDILQQSENLVKSLSSDTNSLLFGQYYDLRARILLHDYKFDSAILSYEKGLACINDDEIEDLKLQSSIINGIGVIYHLKGELTVALEYYSEAITINEQISDKKQLCINYNNLGYIHYLQADLSTSIVNLNKSLELANELDLDYFIATTLFNLIRTHVANKDMREVEVHLQHLERIYNKKQNKTNSRIINCYKLSKGVLHLQRNNFRDIVEAEELFREIIELNLEYQFVIMAIKYLAEIYFLELKAFEDTKTLAKIKDDLISEMYQIGQDQQIFSAIVEALIFKAQLSVIERKYDQANTLLDQAILTCKERALTGHLQRVRTEKEKLLRSIQEIKNVVRKTTIAERIDRLEILNYIKKAQEYTQ